MIIKGTGEQFIINKNFPIFRQYDPNFFRVYINGEYQIEKKSSYYLNKTENRIRIIFDFSFNKCNKMFSDLKNIVSIDLTKFDFSKIKEMNSMFFNCYDLSSINLSNANTSLVTDMSYLFSNCFSLISLDLINFDTSSVINMNYMFGNCTSLTSVNISNFVTSKVKSMSSMFNGCYNLISIDLSNLTALSLTTMESMFYNCKSLKDINLQMHNKSNLINMSSMFYGCISLTTIDASDFTPSFVNSMFYSCESLKEIIFSNFDISEVTNMDLMFYNCYKLTTINISNFNTSKVTNMKEMFSGCLSLTSFELLNFDVSSLDNMSLMFFNCESIKEIKLSTINGINKIYMDNIFKGCKALSLVNLSNFNPSSFTNLFSNMESLKELYLSNINTSGITSMENMFSGCSSLIYIDLSNLDTSSVTSMSRMFYNCSKLTYFNISNLDTSNIKTMNEMFKECYNLISVNLSNFNAISLSDMSSMFYNCLSLKDINLSMFNKLNPINMEYLFYECISLSSINLSDFILTSAFSMFFNCKSLKVINFLNFNTSHTNNMGYMFSGCTSLTSIDLSNYDTSNVEYMYNMFNGCVKLEYLNINNFNMSKIIQMQNMFSNCKNLISLNLSNFNTHQVQNMDNLFSNCSNLLFINLTHFDTSSAYSMQNMFSGCENLLYLDLSDFNTKKVTNFNGMFQDCNSLIYLNFYLLNSSYHNDYYYYSQNMFYNISDDLKYCTNSEKIDSLLNEMNKTNNCSDICSEKNIKFIPEKRICIKKCEYDSIYKYEYNSICYEKCPDGTYNSKNDEYICESCNINCKKCIDNGNNINNNCLECYPGMILLNNFNNNNCYKECEFYYYFDENENYCCTEKEECPEDYKFLYKETCYNQCPNGTIAENDTFICYKENIEPEIAKKDEELLNYLDDIQSGKKKDIFNNVTENKQDLIEDKGDLKIQFTSSENQKNSSNKNMSSIDLGVCEERLKVIYDINRTLPLLIFKFDYYSKDTKIPIIGYEIYHPINNSKLNLSYCEDLLVKLNIPVNIDENELFKYDPSSGYYTDNCYAYTTEDGTDIILSDRKKEYGENNMSLCENNCNYTGYNSENKQSTCDCDVKNKMELVSDIVNNQNKLNDQFSSEQSSSGTSNIITIKCTKALFTAEGLKNNISSYVTLATIFYFLLSILLFIKCGYPLMVNDMKKIVSSKKNIKNKKNIPNQITSSGKIKNNNNKITKIHHKIKNKTYSNPPPPKQYNFKVINNLNISKNINADSSSKINIQQNHKGISSLMKTNNKNKKRKKHLITNNKKNKTKINNINNKYNVNTIKKTNVINDIKSKQFSINAINYNDYELNTLDYHKAIIFDKRSCCNYYTSLLKMKHPIPFAFCPNKDYNSILIKLCIFLLSFNIYYAINFAFFNEDVIHTLYENGGVYDIIYFIPYISISFAASHLITIIIKLIFLTDRDISKINQQDSYNAAYSMTSQVQRNIVCKYIIFYILGLIFLVFFWILLSSFGAVYQNTQIIVFENTLISFGISFIYPIFFNVIPCVLRTCALNNNEKKISCIYNMSKFLQIL